MKGKLTGIDIFREFRGGARMTGAYSLTDFQLALPEYEARDTLNILEALGICIKVTCPASTFFCTG